MSKIYRIGEHWKGFKSIRRLVIFGDSYSSVDDWYLDKRPDAYDPLGVTFPGTTWNEPDRPNWVGHLITKYCPQPRYMPNNADKYGCPVGNEEEKVVWDDDPFLVHNYARGGDRVPNVVHQIQKLFLPDVGKKPDWAQWTPTGTLFVTWVGINDCASIPADVEMEGVLKALMNAQDDLYNAGARNFLLIDVPTIHRSPAGKRIHRAICYFEADANHFPVPDYREETVMEKIQTWNNSLGKEVEAFASAHSDATVLLFSSYETFDTFLDNAEQNGLKAQDRKRYGGDIWVDHIHPTSRVHDNIASRVAAFLDDAQPSLANAVDQQG